MNHENKIISNKSDRQELGVQRFIAAKQSGTLHYTPRFGKTITSLLIAKTLFDKKPHRILIVVKNETLVVQWKETISDFNQNHNCNLNYHISTEHKIGQNLDYEAKFSLMILDEVHRFLTPSLLPLITGESKITAYLTLGLTGSYPTGLDGALLSKHLPVLDYISEPEALSKRWISEYFEYNYKLDFTDNEKSKYMRYSELIKETLELFTDFKPIFDSHTFKDMNKQGEYVRLILDFEDSYDFIRGLYAGKKDKVNDIYVKATTIAKMYSFCKGFNKDLDLSNKYNEMLDKYWSTQALLERGASFKYYVEQRNAILTDSPTKFNEIISILEKFNTKQSIIYVGSTRVADNLYNTLQASKHKVIIYHSKIESQYVIGEDGEFVTYKTGDKKGQPKKIGKETLKSMAIEGMKNKTYNTLITVNSLNEGIDLPTLDLGILAYGSTNSITYRQRSSRVKTLHEDKEFSCIINLYFDNFSIEKDGELIEVISRDKSKLLSRQESSKFNVITADALELINF